MTKSEYMKEYRKKNKKRLKKYWQEWYKKHKKEVSTKQKEYVKKNGHKRRAKSKVHYYLKKNGKPKFICFICKENPVTEFHHPDYSKPLLVIPLCHSCHMQIERNGKECKCKKWEVKK